MSDRPMRPRGMPSGRRVPGVRVLLAGDPQLLARRIVLAELLGPPLALRRREPPPRPTPAPPRPTDGEE